MMAAGGMHEVFLCPACGMGLDITATGAAASGRYTAGRFQRVTVRCHPCGLQETQTLGHQDQLPAYVDPLRAVIPDAIRAFAPIVERAKQRRQAVGIGLEEAIQMDRERNPTRMPHGASYDTDTVAVGVKNRIDNHITWNAGNFLSGSITTTDQWTFGITTKEESIGGYAASFAELLLVLPFEHGIPTDTGWIPGLLPLMQGKPYDLRYFTISERAT